MTHIKQDQIARDTARRYMYQFFSIALSDPRSKRWRTLHDRSFMEAVSLAVDMIRVDPDARPSELAPGEFPPDTLDISSVVENFRTGNDAIVRDYDKTFGLLVPKECPPYETEYYPQTFSVYRSQKMADVAGFYKAFGVEPSRDKPERHDHVSLELEFMAWLIVKELNVCKNHLADKVKLCRSAQVRFFREHIVWWVPAFSHALLKKASGDFYTGIPRALCAFIAAERAYLSVEPPTELVLPNLQEDTDPSCDGCGLLGGQ